MEKLKDKNVEQAKKSEEDMEIDLHMFKIFHNLKHPKSKLMTQEQLSVAITEFEPPHPSAQATIDQTDNHIQRYLSKKQNIATYIAFAENILASNNGPIQVHVDKHKKRLHEVLEIIKGKDYEATDEIDFYEFKLLINILRLGPDQISEVCRSLEDQACPYIFKFLSLPRICRARNLRSEYKKYRKYQNEVDYKDDFIDIDYSDKSKQQELSKQLDDYESYLARRKCLVNRYPPLNQQSKFQECKTKIQKKILPLLSIYSSVKLLLNTYQISLSEDKKMLEKGEVWLNSHYKIAFFIQFFSLMQYFTINYSLIIHLMQQQQDFNQWKFQSFSLPMKIWKICSITFLGYISQALVLVISAFAALLSIIFQVLGLCCSKFEIYSSNIDNQVDQWLLSLYCYTKQSKEGRMFQRKMIFLFMRDFVTLTLSALIYFDVLICPELKNRNAGFWLIFNALMGLISSFTLIKELYIKSTCYDEPMVKLTLLSMSTMKNHYPFQNKIQEQTLDHSIDYANIESKIPDILGTLKQTQYQFNNYTFILLGQHLKFWQQNGSWFKKLYTINLSESLEHINIMSFLYFYQQMIYIPKVQNIEMPVNIILDVNDKMVSKMVDNAIKDKKWFKQENGYYHSITTSRESIIKVCIDSEPEDQSQIWKLEFCMREVLKKGYDPNILYYTERTISPIKYAEKQNKKRSVQILLEFGANDSQVLHMNEYSQQDGKQKNKIKEVIYNNQSVSQDSRIKQRRQKQRQSFIVPLIITIKECNSTFDFLSDYYILFELFKSEHTAWFTFTLFIMLLAYQICYVPFINMLLNRDSLRFSGKQNLYDKLLAITIVTPLVLIYLITLDISFIITTLISFIILTIFKLSCGLLGTFNFDQKIDSIFALIFSMTLNDVEGMRALKNLSQLFFESIPQIILQIRILIWLQSNQQSLLYQNINMNALLVSILSGILHTVLEFCTLLIESNAFQCSLLEYIMISMNGRFDWIPLIQKLFNFETKSKKQTDLTSSNQTDSVGEKQSDSQANKLIKSTDPHNYNQVIDFEQLGTQVCGQTFLMRLNLYDSSLALMIQTFTLMEHMDLTKVKFKIYFVEALDTKRVTFKKLIEFMLAAQGKVYLETTGLFDKMKQIIDQDPKTKSMLQSELIPIDQQHPMISMAEIDQGPIVEYLATEYNASIKAKKVQGKNLCDIAFNLNSIELIKTLMRVGDEDLHTQISDKLEACPQDFVDKVVNQIIDNGQQQEMQCLISKMKFKQRQVFVASIKKNDNIDIVRSIIGMQLKSTCQNIRLCLEQCHSSFNQRLAQAIFIDIQKQDYNYLKEYIGKKFQEAMVKQLLNESIDDVKNIFEQLENTDCTDIMFEFIQSCLNCQKYYVAAASLNQLAFDINQINEIIENHFRKILKSVTNKRALSKFLEVLKEQQFQNGALSGSFISYFTKLYKFNAFEKQDAQYEGNSIEIEELKGLAIQILNMIKPFSPKFYNIKSNDTGNIYSYGDNMALIKHSIKYPDDVQIIGNFQMVANHYTGLVYMIGGDQTLKNLLQIDPDYDFETKKLMPMNQDRKFHSACLIDNDHIIVTGGCNKNNGFLYKCELYTISQDNWTYLPQLNNTRYSHASCAFDNKVVYIIGGHTDFNMLSQRIEKLQFTKPYDKWEIIQMQNQSETIQTTIPFTMQFNENQILIIGGSSNHQAQKTFYILNIDNNNYTIQKLIQDSVDPIYFTNTTQPYQSKQTSKFMICSKEGVVYSINKNFKMNTEFGSISLNPNDILMNLDFD